MKLASLQRTEVATITPETSIDDVIRLFEENRVRHLPIVRERIPIGMVSEGDVLESVGGLLSAYRVSTADSTTEFAGPTRVDQIMTDNVVAMSPEDSAADAARTMLDQSIRAVIIVDQDAVVGIVTETDFLKAFFEEDSLVSPDCRDRRVADAHSGVRGQVSC